MIFAGLGVFGHIVLLMQCVFTRDMPTGGFALLGILTCSAILNGAMKMKELRNYGFAMTACIMSMVPMLYCPCPLFFPFGIWGLLVLNKPDVKDAFR